MLAFNVIYLRQRILLGQVRMQRMKGGDEERTRQLQRDCHFLIIPRRSLSYAHNEVHFGYHAPSDVTAELHITIIPADATAATTETFMLCSW